MTATRFLFVIGTGRCGSTLLAEILAAHPEIGWISRFPRHLARVARALPVAPHPIEAYGLLEQQVSPMLVDPCRDLTAEDAAPWLERRLRRFFETHAQDEARPVFMHKFTGWPRARLVAAVFPDAKFVHVYRDGRSVANSYLQVPWWRGYRGVPQWSFGDLSEQERREWEATDHSWTYLAGLEWKRLMGSFEAARAEIGPQRWLISWPGRRKRRPQSCALQASSPGTDSTQRCHASGSRRGGRTHTAMSCGRRTSPSWSPCSPRPSHAGATRQARISLLRDDDPARLRSGASTVPHV